MKPSVKPDHKEPYSELNPALSRLLLKPQASPRLLRVSVLPGILTCKVLCPMHISIHPRNNQLHLILQVYGEVLLLLGKFPQLPGS